MTRSQARHSMGFKLGLTSVVDPLSLGTALHLKERGVSPRGPSPTRPHPWVHPLTSPLVQALVAVQLVAWAKQAEGAS